MSNFITRLFRKAIVSRNKSKTARHSVPLKSARQVTVLLDAQKSDAAKTADAVRAYFGSKGIELKLFCPTRGDINIFGILKKKVRSQSEQGSDSIFISLIEDPDSWLNEYESNHSPAAYKVGRAQLRGEVYDLVVLSAGHSQEETFEEVKKLLEKVV